MCASSFVVATATLKLEIELVRQKQEVAAKQEIV